MYRKQFVSAVALGLLFMLMALSASAAEVTITAPANGATVSGTVSYSVTIASDVAWVDFHIDHNWVMSSPPYTYSWNTTAYPNGSHFLDVVAWHGDGTQAGTASVTVTVANGTGAPAPSPTPTPTSSGWQVPQGNRIPALTGASRIAGADTNPAHARQYSVWGGGFPILGGPLLSDWDAASLVKATRQSSVEANSWGNQVANNYFNTIAANNPNDYIAQYNAFQSEYRGTNGEILMSRVDGGCPIANPTSAEAMQWAGLKWGMNPLLLYAEATNESGWDQTACGDQGRSCGLMQVADRGYNHAYPGFSGYGSNLSRENTCFNAEFYAAIIYGIYTGVIAKAPPGDIGAAIESWYSGYAPAADGYANVIYGYMGNRNWESWYFGGQPVPY